MSTSDLKKPTDSEPLELGALGRLLPDPLLLVSPAGVVIEANRAACLLIAEKRSSLRGIRLASLAEPNVSNRLAGFLRQCSRSGDLIPGSLPLRDREGVVNDYEVQGAALSANGGPILLRLRMRESNANRFRILTEKIDELANEVGSRRRAESLLEQQLQILQLIVTAAPLETVLEALVKFAEAQGSGDLLASVLLLDESGKHLRHGAAPSLPDAYNKAIDGVAIGPAVGCCGSAAYTNQSVVARDIATDRRWRDFKEVALEHGLRSCWSTPIPSAKGSVLGTFALYYRVPIDPPSLDRRVVDIATRIASIAIDRKHEEARIEWALARERLARSEAESANQAKDEFLALISHELRNPLNAMLGWTRLLQTDGIDEETFQQGLKTIERNVQLQSQLITDVLDFARVASGHLQLEREPARITQIVESAINSMLPDATRAGLRLDLDAEDIGPASCDPARIHQVMTNLISNSIKFTPTGGRVTIRVGQVDDYVRITVTDTGKGIDPAFLPFVFDPFRQADGSFARAYSGLGLGLTVVRRIVELHGGCVSVHSEGEGRGASFAVDLPLQSVDGFPTAPPEPRRQHDMSGLRLLVVEDESDARELLGAILRHHGAEVILAASADEATAALDASHTQGSNATFAAMISDIAMPGTDGYALMRAVRARDDQHATIPAAALTAHTQPADRALAYQAGFHRHLSKPVDPDELLAVIGEMTLAQARGQD